MVVYSVGKRPWNQKGVRFDVEDSSLSTFTSYINWALVAQGSIGSMLLDCVAEDIDDRLRSQRSKASRRQLDINPFVWFCRSTLDGHICFLASQKFKKISSEIILLLNGQQEMTGGNSDVELGLRK